MLATPAAAGLNKPRIPQRRQARLSAPPPAAEAFSPLNGGQTRASALLAFLLIAGRIVGLSP